MNNSQIAEIFVQVADLLEFEGSNPFRIRAYRSGARAIAGLSESVASIVADPSRELTDIQGIGKDLAAKCATLVDTGSLPLLDELKEKIPDSVLDVLRVRGLGPKKAATIFKDLGIKSLDELEAACHGQQLRGLKGFGAKTEAAILKGIEFAKTTGDRMLWAKADGIVQSLLEHMESCDAVERKSMAGSYRRGKETVGDLDLLVVSDDTPKVMDHFVAFPQVTETLLRGDDKVSVVVNDKMQIDLRVVPAASYGAAMQYFTGSKEHNVVVRGLAKKRGLRINEYGVYDAEGNAVAGATEADVYAAIDLPYFEPEMRENRFEFEGVTRESLPELVSLEDIQGDLHMHTTATDGKGSIREMVDAAMERGLTYVAITDHSKRVSMANGLDPERLLAQWKEIDAINEALGDSFSVLKGIECDILEGGGMDLPDDVLAQADWVLASVHYGQRQTRDQITSRILGALENPHVSAIAHPTGRLLNKREPYQVDLEQVFDAAKQHGKFLELNANPLRLDLNDVYCAAAKKHGIPIVINTDAHSVDGLGVLRYGILQARRGGLTRDDVANAWPWPELKRQIGNKA